MISTLGCMFHVSIFLETYKVIAEQNMTDIANYIYEHPDELDLALKGIWIGDREQSTAHSTVCLLNILTYSRPRLGCCPDPNPSSGFCAPL